MNKTVAIVVGSVGVLLVVGVVVYLMQGEAPGEDEYSTFGFTNEATNRPAGASDEFSYGEDGVDGYDSDILSQDGEGGADGDGTLYERSIAGQFPAIEQPEEASADVGTQDSPKSTVRTSNTNTTRTSITDTPVESPEVPVLSIVSPKAGDVIVNDDGCPEDADLGDDEQPAPCIPEPIGRVFWNYGNPTAKMTLELYNESGTRVRTFATKTGNSGRYTWEYSPTIPSGDYKIVATAYDTDGDILTTAETGLFEVTKSGDPTIGTPTPSITCPSVPSKTRTYTKTYSGMSFYCTPENGGCVDQVQLKHYRYPENLVVGTSLYLMERCALTATPGSRTCPYPNSIYGTAADKNNYSIMMRDPDPTNDPDEVGDRKFSAYLKPLIGIGPGNRAFDISIPFTIASNQAGKEYDFMYTVENQNLRFTGQYSISECEGDYSQRALWSQLGAVWSIRASILATSDLEGIKKIGGQANPILALKAGKTYYLNLRWLKEDWLNGTSLTKYSPTDDIPDDKIHDHALWRQLAKDPTANYLEFYRFDIFQYNFANFPTESQLAADPAFDNSDDN